MVTSIPRIQSALDFFLNEVLIYYCCYQIFEIYHILLGNDKLWFCSAMWWRDRHTRILSFHYVCF